MTTYDPEHTETTLTGIEELLVAFRELNHPVPEHTILNIGGRGHYENATTDVLAFFLDPKQAHGLNRLVLDALLESASLGSASFKPVGAPLREWTTGKGNRIDLVIECENTVLVIENKIRHAAVNDFTDYRDSVKKCWPDKEAVCMLLTMQGDQQPGWHSATYASLCERIRAKLSECDAVCKPSKWPMLLRELIVTLEQEMSQQSLNQHELDFFSQHHGEMRACIDLFYRYLNDLGRRAIDAIERNLSSRASFRFVIEHWKNTGMAVRVYEEGIWHRESNVTLIALNTGGFRCSVYAWGGKPEDEPMLRALVQLAPTPKAWAEKGGALVIAETNQAVTELDTALDILVQCAERLTKLHSPPAGPT